MSTEEPGADGPTMGRGKRLRRAMQPYRTPLWLLALAIVFGVLAYRIYPTDAPAAPENAVQGVAVLADFTPSAIAVSQTPDPAVNGFRLQIILHAKRRGVAHRVRDDRAARRRRGDQPGCPAPASAALPIAPASRTLSTTSHKWATPGKRSQPLTATSCDRPSRCPTSRPM